MENTHTRSREARAFRVRVEGRQGAVARRVATVEMDTPPDTPEVELNEEDEMLYMSDVDEVLEESDEDEVVMSDLPKVHVPVPKDDAACVFTKHDGSVFCGSLSRDGKLAVTGGQDDKAFIWDTASGEVVFECNGHKDSVIFAKFNRDESYLATGDMGGTVQAWRMSDKKLVWNYSMGDATWMLWHTEANVLFGGSTNGEVYMWKIPSGHCKIFQGYGQSTETAVIMPDGKRLLVGYDDGSIRVLDLKSGSVATTILPDIGHSEKITALDCHPDNVRIISSAMDGKTLLSTSNSHKVVMPLQDFRAIDMDEELVDSDRNNLDSDRIDLDSDISDLHFDASNSTFIPSLSDSTDDYVETLAFCRVPEFPFAATGTQAGCVYIWDVDKKAMRHKVRMRNGVVKLVWKKATAVFLTACFDGILRVVDALSGNILKSYAGHSKTILDLDISEDGKLALTTGDDCEARIFKIY